MYRQMTVAESCEKRGAQSPWGEMPSPEHEQMVTEVVESGMRTPDELPSPDVFVAIREAEASTTPPDVAGCSVSAIDAGGVPGVMVTPDSAIPTSTILYLHGGGYLFMTARTHLAVMAALAVEAGAACLGIDYRRAPEHRFPAPVDDAVAVYQWLLDSGRDPGAVALAGDSAGGGLVLATLIALRDLEKPTPTAAVCFSPWTDLAVTGSTADSADDPVVGGVALRMMAAAYLGGSDPLDPLASPLYADLRGLPPVQIQVGGRESLLDDARRFADRASGAGVAVTYLEHPGVIHMWIVFDPDIPESKAAFAAAGRFLSDHFARSH
jgi:monoterpene epsilon-lactone hydrolase